MNPLASIDSTVVVPWYPFWARSLRAEVIALVCSLVSPGSWASAAGFKNTWYLSTATPSTVPVPMKSAPVTSCCSRLR